MSEKRAQGDGTVARDLECRVSGLQGSGFPESGARAARADSSTCSPKFRGWCSKAVFSESLRHSIPARYALTKV